MFGEGWVEEIHKDGSEEIGSKGLSAVHLPEQVEGGEAFRGLGESLGCWRSLHWQSPPPPHMGCGTAPTYAPSPHLISATVHEITSCLIFFPPHYGHKEGEDENVGSCMQDRKRRMERTGAAIRKGCPEAYFQRICNPLLSPSWPIDWETLL